MKNLPVDKFDSLVAAMTRELVRGCTRLHVDEEQKTTRDLIDFICDDKELSDEFFIILEKAFSKKAGWLLMEVFKEKAALQFCEAWAHTEYQPVDEEGVAV